MKRKIPCLCDNSFEIEAPEEIDLDSNKEYLEQILDGSFFNFNCPSCNKKHKPEFPLRLLWPSRNLNLEILPELDRGEFYRKKKQSKDTVSAAETIIGYPEMVDRLTVIRDGLEPISVEAIKYYLQLKAEEQYPEDEMDVWYYGFEEKGASGGENTLEFHIHGIRQNEVAVMKVPYALYQKTLDDYKNNPKKDIFVALRVGTYLSVKNTMNQGVF